MGNCMAKKKQRDVTLAMLGIDNAGKTSVLKCLAAAPLDGITPTVGFSREVIDFDKFRVTCYDLGGGLRIRNIWKNYLAEVYGIIYVMDASDHPRLEESGQLLTGLIEHPRVRGKPILLLLNKQDKDQAVDEVDITEMLNLQTLVNYHKCPCRVDSCCANKGTGKKADPAIRSGFLWLLSWINSNWDKVNQRVESDLLAHGREMAEEKKQVEERVRRARADREKEEQGEEKTAENGDDLPNGNLTNGHILTEDPASNKLPPLIDPRRAPGVADAMKSITLPTSGAYSSDSIRSGDHPRPIANQTESFGLSNLSASDLPAVSPGVERRLPAIVPPSKLDGADGDSQMQAVEFGVYQPDATFEAVHGDGGQTQHVDLAAVEEAAIAKRKRKRRRLRRLNKTAPSTGSETDTTSSTSGGRRGRELIDLATLQSSEPRPQTPDFVPNSSANSAAAVAETVIDDHYGGVRMDVSALEPQNPGVPAFDGSNELAPASQSDVGEMLPERQPAEPEILQSTADAISAPGEPSEMESPDKHVIERTDKHVIERTHSLAAANQDLTTGGPESEPVQTVTSSGTCATVHSTDVSQDDTSPQEVKPG